MKNITPAQPCLTFLFPSQKTEMTGQVVSKGKGQGWPLIIRARAHTSCSQQDLPAQAHSDHSSDSRQVVPAVTFFP